MNEYRAENDGEYRLAQLRNGVWYGLVRRSHEREIYVNLNNKTEEEIEAWINEVHDYNSEF